MKRLFVALGTLTPCLFLRSRWPGRLMADPPPWWQTPRHSAWRAACWLLAGGWAVFAVVRAFWSAQRDIGFGVTAGCRPAAAPIAAELVVAAAGIGLIIYSLTVPPRDPRRRVATIALIAAAWAAIAYGWLPHNPEDCVN